MQAENNGTRSGQTIILADSNLTYSTEIDICQ